MAFSFGPRSLLALRGVHPDLVRVVKRALELTKTDFTVIEGLRSLETQKLYVARGASQTMNSKHLKQPDGYGHAVDLAHYIGGKIRWDWPLYYPLAETMRTAAIELGVRIRWGGAWTWALNDTTEPATVLSHSYQQRKILEGKKPFLDGPHFELM